MSGHASSDRSGDTADCMGLRREAHGRDSGTSHNHSAHFKNLLNDNPSAGHSFFAWAKLRRLH
jgi:hypothetical protein